MLKLQIPRWSERPRILMLMLAVMLPAAALIIFGFYHLRHIQRDRHLCYLRPAAPFVTAFLAQIDSHLGKVTYCNAGHFPPIPLRADGRTELLEIGGPLLGAIEHVEFDSGEIVLEPGDTLVAYSDGVLECCNPSGEEFGSERLLAALQNAIEQGACATLVMLLAALQDYANGSPICDDVSLTVIQRDAECTDVEQHLSDELLGLPRNAS